ncbi:MAG: hypothetical protein H7Z72_20590 [Bacteroidetes bacterium]|nr:hypothetical protein [Fibrella sp.]
MTTLKQISYLLLAMAGLVFLPYLGAWTYHAGLFPAHFFDYPPLSAPPKSGFNGLIFSGIAVVFVLVILLYAFPRLFGFRRVEMVRQVARQPTALPVWFWVGLVLWGGTLLLLWTKSEEPKWLLNWAYLPLFWGFTFVIDGWVYIRANGESLVSRFPREVIGIGVAATSGWMLFEYLNFFVDENWYYPRGDIVPDDEFTVYAIAGSSGLMPTVFELYTLMNTFRFRHRFDRGPKITLPKSVGIGVLVLAFSGMFAIGFFPDGMFGVLWLSPLLVLSVVLERIGIWTPFTPVKEGNWSPLLKYALTYLIYGFLLEWWNYYNSTHDPADPGHIVTFTPAHWVYSLPYVNRFHVFEMPLLGYLGYLPFGVYCAVWWIAFAFLLNIPTQFARDDQSLYILKS